jgi:hypothetical protein
LSKAPNFSASGNRSCIGVYLPGRRTLEYSGAAGNTVSGVSVERHARLADLLGARSS